jgi:predicted NAD/FAD-dependent oxidoreductase
MRIGIIGAGMAGLACAEGLAGQGHDVILFDKGRGPGGRMSTRRLPTPAGEAHFDHGAQYFTARDDAFRRRLQAWLAAGSAAAWPSAGDDAYVGVPAMNEPIRSMAAAQTVRWATRVTRLQPEQRGWRLLVEGGEAIDLDIVVVATPAEQAADLLAANAPFFAARARDARSEPCWTVMLAFADPVPVVENCWRGEDVIAWAARNRSKPGRVGPESWVVQASPVWSMSHLEAEPEWVAATLEAELSTLLRISLPDTVAHSCHRWRFARSGADGAGALYDRTLGLGVCGDWLIEPRVEAAWLSGTRLAAQIAQ